MLKKGDPRYVRMNGLIKQVEYLGKAKNVRNYHWIKFKSGKEVLINRFVCMTGLNKGNDMGKNITTATMQDIENTNDRINKIKDVLIPLIMHLQVEIVHAKAAEMIEILEEV